MPVPENADGYMLGEVKEMIQEEQVSANMTSRTPYLPGIIEAREQEKEKEINTQSHPALHGNRGSECLRHEQGSPPGRSTRPPYPIQPVMLYATENAYNDLQMQHECSLGKKDSSDVIMTCHDITATSAKRKKRENRKSN